MTTRTQYFEDPLVKIGIEDARFPHICPICGKEAKHITKVLAAPNAHQYPHYRQKVRARLLDPRTKTFLVYVCDEHFRSDEGQERGRFLCMLSNALFISLMIFGIMSLGGDLALGRPVSPFFVITLSLLVITLLLSIPTFRPGPLENAVRVIGFDAGFRNVWLQLKNGEFKERFIEENAMKIELVRWIRKI